MENLVIDISKYDEIALKYNCKVRLTISAVNVRIDIKYRSGPQRITRYVSAGMLQYAKIDIIGETIRKAAKEVNTLGAKWHSYEEYKNYNDYMEGK